MPIRARLPMRIVLALAPLLAACGPTGEAPDASGARESGRASTSVPGRSTPPMSEPASAPVSPPAEAVLVAAGDIASCDYETDTVTGELIRNEPDAVVAPLGDLVYPEGSAVRYADCYDPAWGAFKERTRPAIGNHDVRDDDGDAYYAHFGAAAGEAGKGWYSYELGSWHVVVLNSNCDLVECGPESEQVEWLRADLAASDATCTLAYWHHPRFSSSRHGNDPAVAEFWEALYADGAEVVMAGHDHVYERFAPQAPDASADPERGIRQFTAGTGGKDPYDLEERQPNSERLLIGFYGILRLSLSADGYAWSFLTVDGRESDAGEGTCH